MAEKNNQFQPGQSGNPNGRPKGAKNRTTAELRQHIQTVLDGQYDKLESDLNSMSPFQRTMMITKLNQYFMPVLTKNENDTNVSGDINITVSFADSDPADIKPDIDPEY